MPSRKDEKRRKSIRWTYAFLATHYGYFTTSAPDLQRFSAEQNAENAALSSALLLSVLPTAALDLQPEAERNTYRERLLTAACGRYFSWMNIMPKLTESSRQHSQIARQSKATVRMLPSPAPTPNTKTTPR